MTIQAGSAPAGFTIWTQLTRDNFTLLRHYLLYPNPWPKPAHLKRRVHGSADFADLLALGGQLELRSNWGVYVEEFGSALSLAGHVPVIDRVNPETPVSLHERKYLQSQHPLWHCVCQLGHNSRP